MRPSSPLFFCGTAAKCVNNGGRLRELRPKQQVLLAERAAPACVGQVGEQGRDARKRGARCSELRERHGRGSATATATRDPLRHFELRENAPDAPRDNHLRGIGGEEETGRGDGT